MVLDKATLQSQLNRLSQDWAELQAGLAQRQEEIQHFHKQIAQKSADIERQKGALAYNQILAQAVKDQLGEVESSASDIGETP